MTGHCFGTLQSYKNISDKFSNEPLCNKMDAKIDGQFLLSSLEVMLIKRHLDAKLSAKLYASCYYDMQA